MPAREDELGALWVRKMKDGQEYFTGTIRNEQIVIFANGYKDSDKQPDFKIYKSKPKPERV